MSDKQLKPGDTITMAGAYKVIPSGRKWWQLWKPRTIISDELATFTVVPMTNKAGRSHA